MRDREFSETLKEFNNWLCRLAKRLGVEDVLIKIKGYEESTFIADEKPYKAMFEYPSWSAYGEKVSSENWCEYLMWGELRYDEDNLLCGKPE